MCTVLYGNTMYSELIEETSRASSCYTPSGSSYSVLSTSASIMLTAKLVGEGFARPNAENELPLDINYAKLNEWLVSALQIESVA